MKLWEKINNVTGNSTKARYLVDFINQGAKFIVASLPEKFLWTIATESEVDGFDLVASGNPPFTGSAGSSTPYDKILAVYRYDGSTKANVVHTEGSEAFTITTEGAKKRVCTEVPISDIHIFDEENSIKRPTKMFPKYYKLSGKVFIKPDPDYNSDDNANGSYTDSDGYTVTVNSLKGDKGVIVYAAPPIVDENTDSWILAEYENVALNYAASMDCMRVGGSQRDTATTSLTNVATALANYKVNFPSNPIVVTPPTKTISDPTPDASLPTLNLFNNVSLPSGMVVATNLPSDFTITEGIDSIVDLSIATPLPTMPQNVVQSLTFSEVDDAQAKAKALIDDSSNIGGGATADTELNSQNIQSSQKWLIQEDPEMVEANLAVASQELQRAASHIQEEQLKLQNTEATLQSNQTKFQADLQKYQAEIAEESARIQEQMQKHQADVAREVQEINSQISKYTTEVQKEGARVGADIQVAQAEIGKLQARFNSEAQHYQTELATKQAVMQQEVQQYQSDIQKYSAEVGHKTQLFQADVAISQKFITEATTELQKSQAHLGISQQQYGLSGQYYQKSIGELSAITGGAAAPPEQQTTQRREERKSS